MRRPPIRPPCARPTATTWSRSQVRMVVPRLSKPWGRLRYLTIWLPASKPQPIPFNSSPFINRCTPVMRDCIASFAGRSPPAPSARWGNGGCANLTPPSSLVAPSSLANTSLGAIKNALQSVVSQGAAVYKMLPFTPVALGSPFAPSCSGDIGANSSLTEMHYGDQTRNTCTEPNPFGILANFNWPYKDQLTCIKNQGVRGTCHIFAATSAMEQLIARDTAIM